MRIQRRWIFGINGEVGVWFKNPLKSAGVDINKLRDEFYDMMLYAAQFISFATLDYRAV